MACWWVGIGHAHEVRPGIADVTIDGANLLFEWRVELEPLMADADDDPNTHDDQAIAELRRLSAGEFGELARRRLPDLLQGIDLRTDTNEPITLDWQDTRIREPREDGIASDSLLVLEGVAPAGARFFTWQSDARLGPIVLRSKVADGDSEFNHYLIEGQRSAPIALISGAMAPASLWSAAANYFGIGFRHILPLGLDHVLFVLGLFLLNTRFGPLVWQVTTFTLAHSVTLAMGMLGWITLSAGIVEPLIALSIVAICLDNLSARTLQPRRTLLIFLFGLLHGLGFAGVLGEIGLAPNRFLMALVSFNIGVEAGQLTVIALAFMLVGWLRHHEARYRRWVLVPGSMAIGAIGAFWFVQRVTGW